MTIAQIHGKPTNNLGIPGFVHESVFRSYHCLQKVVDLLKKNVPAEVILELIEEMLEDENKRPDA